MSSRENMTKTPGFTWPTLIVPLAAFGCAGTRAFGKVAGSRDSSVAAIMTEKRKTVCVGRYLVDVPAQADVSFSGAVLDGFDIHGIEETEAEVQKRVIAREAEIVAHGASTDGSGGMVGAHDLRVPGVMGRVFVFGRKHGYWFESGQRVDDEWVAVELHVHSEGLSLSLSDKFDDARRAEAAVALLARLRIRADDLLPDLPGFCIGRAVFVEPLPAHKNEHVVMQLGMPGLINRINGEEVLVRARAFDFTTTYGFSWDASGVMDDFLQPSLSLELQTGISERSGRKPAGASLREDAMLALWDRIAASIRLRKIDASSPPGAAPNSVSRSARQFASH